MIKNEHNISSSDLKIKELTDELELNKITIKNHLNEI